MRQIRRATTLDHTARLRARVHIRAKETPDMTIHHDFVHMVIHKRAARLTKTRGRQRIQELRAEAHQGRLAKLVQGSRRTKKSCRRRTTDNVIDGGIGTSAKTDLAGPLERWHVTAEEIVA